MPSVETKSFRARVDQRVATTWDRRAVDRLATADGRTHRSWTRGTAVVMATVVHLVVLALLAGGLGLLLLGDNLVQRILGVVVLVPAVPLLRTGRVRPDITLDPQTAPVFTALVAELAEGLGTRPPTMIGFNEDYNAYAARVGLRTRLLVIGAPLWAALSPQGRVALLGHELGHFSGRDVVHGRYVWRAYQTLHSWVALSTPAYVEADGRSPLAASLVTWPLRFVSTTLLTVLDWVSSAASRHQELLADTAAAALAGTPAAIEMLEGLMISDVVDVAANRAAVDSRRPDLGAEIRARVDALTPEARRHARAEHQESRVDHTHPPSVERLRLQEALPPVTALVELDEARTTAIDEELAPLLTLALRRTADKYRYVR